MSTEAVVNVRVDASVRAVDLMTLCFNAMECSPQPLVAVRGPTHIVHYSNSAFCRLSGAAPEQLVGRPFAEAVPEEGDNACLSLLDRVYRTGETESLEDQEHGSPHSGVYWSYVAWAITDTEGNRTGSMAQVTDTTEAMQLRRQIAAMNEALMVSDVRQHELTATAEELNYRLQQAMTETHHRVKNNLQIISALAEMQIEGDSPTVPTAALQRIVSHVQTLAGLHDVLTKQAKTGSAKEMLGTQVTLNQLMPLLQAGAGPRRLHCEIAPILLPVQQSVSLSLLLSELVSNALKHGAGDITVTLREDGENADLTVQDQGKGFPADFSPHVAGRTGLDLILSMARHDLRGQARFTNTPDGGACITVTFPLSTM